MTRVLIGLVSLTSVVLTLVFYQKIVAFLVQRESNTVQRLRNRFPWYPIRFHLGYAAFFYHLFFFIAALLLGVMGFHFLAPASTWVNRNG